MPFPPTFDRAWDETFPPDTQLANLLGQDIRNFKTDIRERLSLLSGTFANRPSNMDAIYGGSGFGILYFATDTQQLFQWSGAAWVQIGFSGNIVASVSLTGVAANIGTTTLYTSAVSGVYRLTYDLILTTVGTGNVQLTFGWNNGVAAQTATTVPFGSAGALGSEDPNTPTFRFFVPSGQNVTYALAGIAGGAQYALRMRLEFLG